MKNERMRKNALAALLILCMTAAMLMATACGAPGEKSTEGNGPAYGQTANDPITESDEETQEEATASDAEAQTSAAADEETTVSQQENEKEEQETTNSKQEETTEAETTAPVTQQPGNGYQMVSLKGYDTWGYSNGGVIPVRKNGLWGAINFDGQVLVEPVYTQFYSPNNQGYVMFEDGDGFYIYDAKGNLCHTFGDDIYEVSVGNDSVIMLVYATDSYGQPIRNSASDSYWNDGSSLRICYMKMDGTVFYDTGRFEGCLGLNMAVPYSEGKAYVRLQPGSEMDRADAKLYEITFSGAKLLGEHYDISRPLSAAAQGYLLATGTYEAGYYLYQPTKSATDLLWELSFETKYGYLEGWNWSFAGYKSDGVFYYNYNTYGMLTLDFGGEYLDALIDFNDANDLYLDTAIAVYDDIAFDNYQYLAVREGDTAFYIDYSGKVVSPTYMAATSFNDRGYAMVMEEAGTAYVINSSFEKVETIENVSGINIGDVVFVIEDTEGVLHMMYYTGK